MTTNKVEVLVNQIKKINDLMRELDVPEQVLEREVKVFGNGSHVVLPKQHLNKKVRIIVS